MTADTPMLPNLADIETARRAIADMTRRTPVEPSAVLSERLGVPVWLKMEHQQSTGSFKVRGASYAVSRLTDAQRAAGVVGVSTGNHGRGLAHAAKAAGVRCAICMSRLVPRNKVEAIEALGADVRIVGRSQDEAEGEVARLVADEGMTLLPPFDHPDIIAGQGTVGLEIVEQVPDVATVIVPVSGGGLIAGIATAVKAARPEARIVGVSMRQGAAMYESIQAGKPVQVEEAASLADSLGGGIGLDNRFTFGIVGDLVDRLMLVDEPAIARGIRHAYWQERQIVEGAGAVGIAALEADPEIARGPTVLLLSGGNIDMDLHFRVIGGEDVDLMAEATA